MAFLVPKKLSPEEISRAARQSSEAFSASRRTEGIDFYLISFDKAAECVDILLSDTNDLVSLKDVASGLFAADKLREIRYLASPAISEDDLKSISGLASLSKSALADKVNARTALEIIWENLDIKRFPWIAEGRTPTAEERIAAITSTAALIATQETQTQRRNLAKTNQENAVAQLLESLGYDEVPRRLIRTAADAPKKHEFCRECSVSGKKADLVIGLADGRFMALECKVSNSEVNSFKRLNHETVEKIQHWNTAFGTNGVVGAAVLAGVFKTSNLESAQAEGVSLFWSFDLSPLADFLKALESPLA